MATLEDFEIMYEKYNQEMVSQPTEPEEDDKRTLVEKKMDLFQQAAMLDPIDLALPQEVSSFLLKGLEDSLLDVRLSVIFLLSLYYRKHKLNIGELITALVKHMETCYCKEEFKTTAGFLTYGRIVLVLSSFDLEIPSDSLNFLKAFIEKLRNQNCRPNLLAKLEKVVDNNS